MSGRMPLQYIMYSMPWEKCWTLLLWLQRCWRECFCALAQQRQMTSWRHVLPSSLYLSSWSWLASQMLYGKRFVFWSLCIIN